jgi:hypothetical protein
MVFRPAATRSKDLLVEVHLVRAPRLALLHVGDHSFRFFLGMDVLGLDVLGVADEARLLQLLSGAESAGG